MEYLNNNCSTLNPTTVIGAVKELDYVGLKSAVLSLWQQTSWWQIAAIFMAIVVVYDQIAYQIYKGSIAGPRFKVWPVIGPFLESLDPKFEEYQSKWASGPLSCVSIFHKFVVIASTRDLTRKIFQSPQYVKPCVVDVAVKILRPSNWVFLDGKEHSEYRKGLNGLFTKSSLEFYIPDQEKIMDKYINLFADMTKDEPKVFFPVFREVMCAISLKTFCGDYITNSQIKEIADNYYLVTAALELVNFPIIIPYTKTWYGKKIADMTMKIFEGCAQMAKDHIEAGGEPKCVMDAWVKVMKEARDSKDKKSLDAKILIREFSNREISEAVFTFLFASQDASSSLCCWLFQLVADRPDVLKKIREEQLRIRNGNPYQPLTGKLIDEMKYTNMVVRETLRYRPPVLMVPHYVKQAYPVSDNYTIPKGAMVVPTLYPALHDPEVYENPDEFVPERWEEGSPAWAATKNWLVFGTGVHRCLGQTYVLMTFTAFIGKAAMFLDFDHKVTELSEQIKVFATIFPKDDLIMQFRRRDPTVVE